MLVVNKPRGMISKDVSRLIQRQFGKVHIGHVGTLDPLASGVLPILIGSATKMQDYLLKLPKAYEFLVSYGSETDSLDMAGQIVTRSEKITVLKTELEAVLPNFLGEIRQIPPLYSAIKLKGRPLYRYARENRQDEVDLTSSARNVRIDALELLEHQGVSSRFRVRCSKGTYVRALARDLAYAVGSVATVTEIIRTETAGVDIRQAVAPECLVANFDLAQALIEIEKLHFCLPRWPINNELTIKKLQQGQKVFVRQDFFAKSLGVDTSDSVFSFAGNSVLMLDITGRAFGIGMVKGMQEGLFSVHMKRGLQ